MSVENLSLIGLGLAIVVLIGVFASEAMTDVNDGAGRVGAQYQKIEETTVSGFFK